MTSSIRLYLFSRRTAAVNKSSSKKVKTRDTYPIR